MYFFVGDKFMVFDDLFGKYGLSFDNFFRKGLVIYLRICFYLKKCIYGLKCRFYYFERD